MSPLGPPPPGLARAYLEFAEIKVSGKGMSAGAPSGQIEFQFNPKEFQLEKSANWKITPTTGAKKAPPPQYLGANPSAITLEMFLDASDDASGDVSDTVQKLLDACIPTDKSHAKERPAPQAIRFGWDKVYFVGYVDKVSAKYTRFSADGKPIRATCTVSLKELPDEQAGQNPTSGALSATASRQLLAGDSLAGIAYQEYGSANLWRAIADANGIDDPMRVVPGTHLLIPSITDAAG